MLWIGLAALFVGACELALHLAQFEFLSDARRTIVWSKERDEELRSPTGLHVLDRERIWRPRPGARIPWTRDETVNAEGFRGPRLPLDKRPGVLRIATLGPSSTFGDGVAWNDTYSALLVRLLAEHGIEADVLDAAIMGSTIRQGLERYRLDVRRYHPDIVISAYTGLHEHTQAPRCASDDSRIVQGLAMPAEDTSFFSPLRNHARIVQALAWLDHLYFEDGWRERENELQELRLARTVGTFDSPGVRRVAPPDMRDNLIQLATEVREDGGKLYVLLIPHKPGGPLDSPVMHYYQKAVEIACDLEHIDVVQGRLAFYEGVLRGGIQPTDLFLEDGESSDCGHVLLAQALLDAILPHIPSLKH